MKTQTNILDQARNLVSVALGLSIICALIIIQHDELGYPLIDDYFGLKLAYYGTFLGSIGCLAKAVYMVFFGSHEEDYDDDEYT